MKKSLAVSLVFAMILAMLPCFGAAAATAEPKFPHPQYIAEDFNDGIANASYKTNGGKVTQTNNGRKGTIGMYYTSNANYQSVQFPIRIIPGDTYHISVWVKFDETPKTQTIDFVLYNPRVDNGNTAWNQFRTTHDPVQAGKWVELSATYVGKSDGQYGSQAQRGSILPDGTLEIRIGSGIPANDMESGKYAYTIDDFYVFPEVQNNVDSSELMPNGSFASEEDMNASWQKYSNGAISWLSSGAKGTTGAMQIEVLKDWGCAATIYPVDFQYYKRYRLTYWAKAMDSRALGLAPLMYMTFPADRASGTPQWEHIYPITGSKKTLTGDWQLFEYDLKIASALPEKTRPTFHFRVGSGKEKCIYAVDEISMKQSEPHDFVPSVNGYGSLDISTGVTYHMTATTSTKGTFLYKLYDEKPSGDVLLEKGHTDGTLNFRKDDFSEDVNLRLDVIGADSYGNCSKVQSYHLEDVAYEDTVSLKPDQYIWNKDVTTLSATVNYQNETKACQVVTYAAQYNDKNKLVSLTGHTEPIPGFTDKTWKVSFAAEPTAVKVKYFTWVDGKQQPITATEEMNKTTSGEFIYVDANSTAASANGSFSAPYKSLNAARNRLRNRISMSTEKEIYVIFKGGEYVPGSYATMEITEKDYAEDKQIIYTSLDSNRAKFTGAKHVTGFRIYDKNKNIYRASVPAGTQTRQMYVNGIKATRARSPEDAVPFVNLDQGAASAEFNNLGLTSTDTSFLNYQYPNELEMYFTQNWRHQFVTVDTITETEDGLAHFGFTDNKTKWSGIARCNTPARLPVFVENAYELMDEPGEWYLDTHKNYIYYIPREFEDMETADVVIPGMEKLLSIKGTADAPAKNMTFKNIDFEYTTWNYPTTNRAFINGQNATYTRSDNGGQLMDAAVELHNAHYITFDNCDFSKIGSMALKMTGAIQHCNVIGNEFYELAGGGINLGEVNSNDGISVRYPTETKHYITDNVIANNYIHKIGTEFKSAAAIGAGFPKNTVIRNNDLSDGPYSGMHTGWGWGSTAPSGTENFVIEKNYIHDFMNWRLYDGGGIYTLGNTGGTEENPNYLRGNYFVDIQNHYGGIYPDEGSTGWNISDNVIDAHNYPTHYGTENHTAGALWLHIWTTSIQNIWFGNNYSTTPAYREDGTDIEYVEPEIFPDAQWTGESKRIVDEAGIEKQYQNRFDFNLQTIRIPRLYEINAGKEVPLVYAGISSKDRYVDLSDYEITVKSSKPSVATATAEYVTGYTPGTAWITFEILKRVDGEVVHYDEHTFRVVVK